MDDREGTPDPLRITTLHDLAREFDKLRRRAAQKGQVQLSVRDIAARTGKAPSTLDPYLRGQRLCPVDTYEGILRALGVANNQLRPWLDVWERVADTRSRQSRQQNAVEEQEAYSRLPREGGRLPARSIRATAHALDVWRRPRPLSYTNEFLYDVNYPVEHPMRIGIVTGDLRRVRCAEVWVNSENTNMRMSRFEEFSISAIIRFEGALRDEVGRVIHDCIADELSRKIAGRSPVAPGTAVTTGSGQLAKSNGVHYVIHVAAVHGEPGEGYHQILDVGRCVTNALAEMERRLSSAVRSILFPLLGTGVGGAELEPTVSAMLGAALDHLATKQSVKTRTIYFLAYTDIELEVCRNLFDRSSRLSRSAVS